MKRHFPGLRPRWMLCAWILCTAASALFAAQPLSDVSQRMFDFNDPNQRQDFIDSLRLQRLTGIERAAEYLRSTGKPKRWQNGQSVCELMSIEDNGQFIVYTTLDANSAISIAADVVRDDLYYAMSGSGIIIGVWDAGIARPTHQELVGRITAKDGSVTDGHSTAVSGAIAAAGIKPAAKGMAPLAVIWGYEWNYDITEMAAAAMSSAGQAGKIQLSNHSYGWVCGWYKYSSNPDEWRWYGNPAYRESNLFGQYNKAAYDFDYVCYNAPYFLPFRAAGNDRGDTSRPGEGETYYINGSTSATFYAATGPYADNYDNGGFDTLLPDACAKNILTIGAVNDAVTSGIRDLSKATMSTLSAWGPTDDGRIKPDLVTNGVTVYSCSSSSDAAYATLTGTSMSSPAAAGVGAQLIELYGRLFPGQYIRSSTLKALLIHTADDIGNTGPDYKFGWGLINAEAAAEKIILHKRNPTKNNIIEDSLRRNVNNFDDFSFEWDGVSPIKATVCWTDPPGTTTSLLDSPVSKLVNDLDITITAPDGTTKYDEYVLDPFNPNNLATTGDNDRDNVKQVLINTPSQQGIYTIRVDYDNLSGTQNYSLIISGQRQPSVYDLDGDYAIGLSDLEALAGCWLTADGTCDIYPAVGDDMVDLRDFALFSQFWME